MAQKQISRFLLNEKFSRLSGHVPNYDHPPLDQVLHSTQGQVHNPPPDQVRHSTQDQVHSVYEFQCDLSFVSFMYIYRISYLLLAAPCVVSASLSEGFLKRLPAGSF